MPRRSERTENAGISILASSSRKIVNKRNGINLKIDWHSVETMVRIRDPRQAKK